MANEMLTAGEIQKRCRLSRSATYDFIRRLPPEIVYWFGPRTVRVDAEGLAEYLRNGSQKSA